MLVFYKDASDDASEFKYAYIICIISVEIEFDARKDISNLAKHDISFGEATGALFDPRAVAVEDPDAMDESRWVLVGISDKGRLLTVIYTYRNECIRLISARKSTSREAKYYA